MKNIKWDDLINLKTPTLLSTCQIHTLLIEGRKNKTSNNTIPEKGGSLDVNNFWKLTAYCQDTDPLFNMQRYDFLKEYNSFTSLDQSIFAGITLNSKVSILWVLDPQDSYRSSSDEVIVVPNKSLKTKLPNIPIEFNFSDSSYSQADQKYPDLIQGVCPLNNLELFKIGTDNFDSYYPFAVSDFNVVNIHNSAILASQEDLKNKLFSIEVEKKAKKKKII